MTRWTPWRSGSWLPMMAPKSKPVPEERLGLPEFGLRDGSYKPASSELQTSIYEEQAIVDSVFDRKSDPGDVDGGSGYSIKTL